MILKTISGSIVPLDVLNNHYQPLARYEARLLDLHGDWATLSLVSDAPISCLHWGSLVRFTFPDGVQHCQAEGIVVAHGIVEPHEAYQEAYAESSQCESSIAATSAASPSACREITVQLWQCHWHAERRAEGRRWSRIGVLLRLEPDAAPRASAAGEAGDAAEECWEQGWAVDLSANGMRLRTHISLPVKQRVSLQFTLPNMPRHKSDSYQELLNQDAAHKTKRRFTLNGRVLRTERTRTAASHEATICFEHLTSEEGLALSSFLNG